MWRWERGDKKFPQNYPNKECNVIIKGFSLLIYLQKFWTADSEANNNSTSKNYNSSDIPVSQSTTKDRSKKSETTDLKTSTVSAPQEIINLSPISGTLDTMPVPGGVQGQNPTQGLVHWMSAVMAEHMTSNTHHDPTAAVGMHYMWNDVSKIPSSP